MEIMSSSLEVDLSGMVARMAMGSVAANDGRVLQSTLHSAGLFSSSW